MEPMTVKVKSPKMEEAMSRLRMAREPVRAMEGGGKR